MLRFLGATHEPRIKPRQVTLAFILPASLNLAAPAVTHRKAFSGRAVKTREILHLCNAKKSIALFSKTPI
jgi:hypothetical protein